MNLIKRLFSKKKNKQCDISGVVGSSSPKKEQTYMHVEAGTNRTYFTNEPPHIKNGVKNKSKEVKTVINDDLPTTNGAMVRYFSQCIIARVVHCMAVK
jgi:hypothetical protein